MPGCVSMVIVAMVTKTSVFPESTTPTFYKWSILFCSYVAAFSSYWRFLFTMEFSYLEVINAILLFFWPRSPKLWIRSLSICLWFFLCSYINVVFGSNRSKVVFLTTTRLVWRRINVSTWRCPWAKRHRPTFTSPFQCRSICQPFSWSLLSCGTARHHCWSVSQIHSLGVNETHNRSTYRLPFRQRVFKLYFYLSMHYKAIRSDSKCCELTFSPQNF